MKPIRRFAEARKGFAVATGLNWKLLVLLFVVTAGAIAVQHRDFYFSRVVVPEGDFAANTLAIREARHLHRLYGNYSRWVFNHPGPAMFYFEAAGGVLFHDLLGLCPGEHNAHAFTSMLVQAFFWAVGLTIIAGYPPSRVALWIVWIAGWVHFSLTEQAFTSIWPPHTLLMPFFCYCVACASVAAGRLAHLWVLLPTGLILVHNHVAQPLSVVMLALGAGFVLFVRREKTTWELPNGGARVVWVLLCVIPTVVLLWPLVFDLFLGRESNAAAILRHLQTHSDERKTLLQSVHYFLEFSRYWGFHDVPAAKFLGEFYDRPWPLVLWGGLLSAAIAFGWKNGLHAKREAISGYSRFIAGLTVTLLLAAFCALVWGVIMDGAMFAFNGFYIYAIYFLVLVLVSLQLSELMITKVRLIQYALPAGALVFPMWLPVHGILSDKVTGNAMAERVMPLLRAHVFSKERPIILIPSLTRTLACTTLANILEEQGIRFMVPPSWEYLFGETHNIERLALEDLDAEIWRVDAASVSPADGMELAAKTRLFKVAARVSPDAGPWESRFNGKLFWLTARLTGGGGDYHWSLNSDGDILLPAEEVRADVNVSMEVNSVSGPRNSKPRRMAIDVHGQPSALFSVKGYEALKMKISKEIWNAQARRFGVVVLHLRFFDPITPKACGVNGDRRLLSIAFHRLRIDE